MINKIEYGTYTFADDNIESANLFLAQSLLSSQLQVNSLEASVRCPSPAILDFQRNSRLTCFHGGRQRGVFYVQSIARAGPDLYDISATSALGLLTEGRHMGGIYTGQTAREVIADICGSVPFAIQNILADIKLYGWLPIASPRDNLSQVLFAVGAALKTDLEGVLRIEVLWDGISGQVEEDRIYLGASAEMSARTTRVIVTEHQYAPGTEVKQLFEGTAQTGDIITFDEPMHSLTATGFRVLSSGANWAQVSAGTGELTGKAYIHNTRQIARDVGAKRSGEADSVRTVDDATLVSLVNSLSVAERLANYYQCRETISCDVDMENQSPGDCLIAYHPYDRKNVWACVESLDINLSSTMRASMRALVGFKPLQVGGFIFTTRREVILSSRTWTAPDGAISLTAVCIGGGTGGWSGQYGNLPTTTAKTYSSSKTSGSFIDQQNSYLPNVGGEGGEPGEGALGGKVIVETVSVTPGQTFQAVIGTGGAGGTKSASGSVAGSAGTATRFGTISSNNGAASESGYYDTITGETFATKGIVGIKGGKGGLMSQPTKPNEGYTQGETITDRNGVVWMPGRVPTSEDVRAYEKSIDASDGSGYIDVASQLGVGGGPAVGENGQTPTTYGSHSANGYNGKYTAVAKGGPGGRGGNATAPAKQTVRGGGGDGGHGGGGAGGGGASEILTRTKSGYSVNITKNLIPGDSGEVGQGSNGGQGGDGIIILYITIAQPIQSGALMDKSKRFILDKTGRIIVV